MRSLHYCIFAANFLPNLGGVEHYTYNLAKKLIAAGNRVTVVTSNVFSLAAEENIKGIDVVRMPCFNVLAGRFPIVKPNKEFRRLNAVLKNQNFDFAIVQTRFYIHSVYAAMFCRAMKIPFVVIEHGTNHFTVNNPVLDFAGHIYEHMETFVMRCLASEYYGVSKACCEWLEHFHIHAKGCLYNAVNLEKVEAKQEDCTRSFRKDLNLQEVPVVTYTGRLVREKGIQKLVDAVNLLNSSGKRCALLIAGNGDLFEEIQKQTSSHIRLLGRLDFDQIITLLKETDIFCLPTDYPEGFPTSVLEAAAAKCYIVTTTNGGSKELILDKSYGTILENNSAEEIASAIEYAIMHDDYRVGAAEKTYERLTQNFTWDCVSEKVMEITYKLVK